jgi:hypothetical protein
VHTGEEAAIAVRRWKSGLFALLALLALAVLIIRGFIGLDTIDATISFLVYAGVGGLIIVRRDGHTTGWLLVLLGLTLVFVNGISYAPDVSPSVVTWVGSWGWSAVFAVFALLTLTFPSGHLPEGPGLWARLGRAAAWALPVLVVVNASTETLGGPEIGEGTTNPFGFLPGWLSTPMLMSIVVVLIGGAVSLVVKRRRAVGAERAQLTWVVFAFVILATVIVLTFVVIFVSAAVGAGDPGDSVWIVAYVTMIVFPLSFGVAVFRYRLYDIDRIVSRTVSYGLVAGLLALVFFGVALLASLFPTDSDLVIAAATLSAAALFNPLRKRIQARVDRRFNRSRYDMVRVIDSFSGSLRDQVDPDQVIAGWAGVVTETMQPSEIGVWIRARASKKSAAS